MFAVVTQVVEQAHVAQEGEEEAKEEGGEEQQQEEEILMVPMQFERKLLDHIEQNQELLDLLPRKSRNTIMEVCELTSQVYDPVLVSRCSREPVCISVSLCSGC